MESIPLSGTPKSILRKKKRSTFYPLLLVALMMGVVGLSVYLFIIHGKGDLRWDAKKDEEPTK